MRQSPRFLSEIARLERAEDRQLATTVLEYLRDQVLPKARTDKEGLAGLPDGDVCYRATILNHVGLPKTPEEPVRTR